jgi:hypothetical protein
MLLLRWRDQYCNRTWRDHCTSVPLRSCPQHLAPTVQKVDPVFEVGLVDDDVTVAIGRRTIASPDQESLSRPRRRPHAEQARTRECIVETLLSDDALVADLSGWIRVATARWEEDLGVNGRISTPCPLLPSQLFLQRRHASRA